MNLNNSMVMMNRRSFEEVSCNLCGSGSTDTLFGATDWFSDNSEEFYLVECKKCELVFINPMPRREILYGYYYPKDYYTHKPVLTSGSPNTEGVELSNGVKKEFKKIVQAYFYPNDNDSRGYFSKITAAFLTFIFRHRIVFRERWGLIGETGQHLDVGCGNTSYMSAIKKDWLIGERIQSLGIDVDFEAIKNAKDLGCSAYVADSENIPFAENIFNIVTMRQTLEHMPDPLKTLREIFRVTKRGGIIVVEVPNFRSMGVKILKDRWSGIDVPRHLFHFSTDTLIKMLEKAGFKVMASHKWRGTYKSDISIRNMQKYWISDGYEAPQIKIKFYFYKIMLSILDYVYSGGVISVKAFKP